MNAKPCEHIMDSGRNCASPRLTARRYCHWHQRLHTAHYLPGNPQYEPPVLDSANAVALALNHVYRGQSRGLIDGKTARPLQQSLRLALQAYRLLDRPLPTEMVTDDPFADSRADRTTGVPSAVAQASSPAPDDRQPKSLASPNNLTRYSDNQISRSSAGQLPGSSDTSNAIFTKLTDSPGATRPLTPEQERQIAQVVRRSAG